MLPKCFYKMGGETSPIIRRKLYSDKYPNGIDVSNRGAFSVSDTLEFIITVPRHLGAAGVVLRIAADGEDYFDIPFEEFDSNAEEVIYTLKLLLNDLCKNKDGGLYYYEFLFLRGWHTLFTDSINNVDFDLKECNSNRFRLLIHSSDFKTPDWFKQKAMYHIFVDRYAKSKSNIRVRDDAEINQDWYNGIPQFAEFPGAFVKNNMFFGGTLDGIVEKLPEIQSLGIGTIYLSPVFEAYSNHKYDTGNYEKVDEMFGGEAAFDRLIVEAKKYGIKIILDGVFNHTGDNSKYFNRYGKYNELGAYQSLDSEFYDWYTFKDYPTSYDCWWNIEILPRLNSDNEKCREYLAGKSGIGASYVKRSIGGWRLDVADELSDVFLEKFRQSVKDVSEDAIIIGEVWENAADKIAYGKRRHYFNGKQLDSVMNYPLRNGILDFVMHEDAESLYNVLVELYSSYPKCVCDCLMNLLGTHDTERVLTVLADAGTDMMTNQELSTFKMSEEQYNIARRRLMLASVIQYTVYGVPSLFYGDEAGIQGGRDPFCRMPYPWGREDKCLLEHYRKLGTIRSNENVFNGGDFEITNLANGFIAYERLKDDARVLIVANSSSISHSLSLDGEWIDLMSGVKYCNEVEVAPITALILKK